MNLISKLGLAGIGAGGVFGAGIGTSKLIISKSTTETKENINTQIEPKIDWENINRSKYIFTGPTIGETSAKYTSDAQWRFLYLLAGKVFEYIKSKKNIISENEILSFMKSKLNLDSNSYSWTGFKELCTKALEKEDEFKDIKKFGVVKDGVGRLCFMGIDRDDSGEIEGVKGFEKIQLHIASKKGNIKKFQGYKAKPDESLGLSGFGNWNKTNFELWKDFKTSQSIDESSTYEVDIESKWESWYKTAVVGENNSSTKILDILKITENK